MGALVSILIPAYNAERWISDTIESAIGQTWEKKEIIVVDDGSSDHTLEAARRYESAQVKVLRQPNGGASQARNKAFSLSQGDYIQWLDADDLLAPDKIATQMAAVARCGSDQTAFSSAWGRFLYRRSKAQFTPSSLWCDLAPLEWVLRSMENYSFIQPAGWLVSRRLTDVAGPWDVRLSNNDDGEYFSRIVLASDYVRFVPDAKSYYRAMGGPSLSYVGSSGKKLESLFLSVKLIVTRTLSRDNSERTRRACLKYLVDVLIFFYPERPDLVQQAEALAASFGSRLTLPEPPERYAWIAQAFGLGAAKRVQVAYNGWKWRMFRAWDHAMFQVERRAGAKS